MLKYQVEYEPLSVQEDEKRYRERQIKYLDRKASKHQDLHQAKMLNQYLLAELLPQALYSTPTEINLLQLLQYLMSFQFEQGLLIDVYTFT